MTQTTDNPKPGHFQVRVYYEDTDAAGVVYHANYLGFAERARTEYLRPKGYTQYKHGHKDAGELPGVVLVARHLEMDFRASAWLDDLLDVETRIIECKNSSVTMGQTITREGSVLVDIKIVLVAVNLSTGRAVRIPPHLRQIFGG